MTVRVSVVVPTCRRYALLARCLEALVQQDFEPTAYEIIVVDDAASDETKAVVEAFRARHEHGAPGPSVCYIPMIKRHGPAAARNAGWQAARGTIIAFTDDDCIPDPGWLAAGVAPFGQSGQIVGVWGQVIMPLPESPTDYELNAAQIERAEFVTANCFSRRDAIAAAGGFDERFELAWREDSDLRFRLMRQGGRIVHGPGAIVAHPVRPGHWGISLSQQRKNVYNALLYKKHPQLYRGYIQASPPWRYYGLLGALVLMLVSGWLADAAVAITAAGIWLLLTAQFCALRLEKTSRAATHVLEMIVTSILIPPIAVFWRLYGAIKFRVFFF